ncbi:MAG: type II toxin-antitoxin system ParD family antitoxin [Saprospiraceae bacterium]|nr:type II toxin-antitoxin system ParD family antitoxin [Saprospiraceae bacterium]
MGKNTSISLGQRHEDFIYEQLKSGSYKNASEVVRAGLRLLEEREQKIQMLRQALEVGIQSGITTDFDPDEFLKELHQSRK